MPTTIESLELQVQQNATSAVGGIDALSASLSRLKNAVKGGVGLNSVANQVRNLDTALKSVDGSSADKINRLADSLSKLKGLGNIKLSSSIGNQLKNISSAASALNSADLSGLGKLSAALQPLNNIGKASGLKSAITQLQKLPQLAQTLNGINWATLTSQLQQLSNSLAPLANQLNTVSNAFGRLPTNIRRVVTATNALPATNNRAATSYVNLWAKFTMAIQAVRTGARVIASWITESNSYIENLNLFNASMGKYTEEARRYAEQVGELMGIDPGEFMRNQGIFMTITEGFGVASDRAYIMSKNLTQLGYDLSSFFNISFADAMQKLESGISGELEPLRRLGYDLSQARLQQEAWNLGIERNITDMTQAEKAQLRYYAIMTQVTTAQGDMARTLNAPANQLRILQSQVVQAARALGNIFIPILNAVLPYAIALAKVIRILANTIASFFGFKLPEIDYSGVSAGASAVRDLADNAGDAGKGLGNAAKGAKKLKNALLGIDELNIISPNDSSSLGSGGGAGGGAGGIGGSDLGFELPEYDFIGDLVNSKVDEIVKMITDALNEITAICSGFMLAIGTILVVTGANIPLGLGLMAAGAVGLASVVIANWDAMSERLAKVLTTVTSVLGGFLLAIGAFLAFSGVNVPLGAGLMVAGATSLATAAAINWKFLNGDMSNTLSILTGIVSGGLLAMGALFAFTGVSVPLGIALMAAGAVGLATTVGLNWDAMSKPLKNTIGLLEGIVGGALLTFGAILAFTGVNIPLGVGMIAAGAVSLVSAVALNWDSLTGDLSSSITSLTAIVSGALLGIGAILALTGVATGLGIGMLAVGAVGLAATVGLNWNSMTNEVRKTVTNILLIVGAAALAIGAILAFTGAGTALGVGLMLAGAASIGTAVALNWDSLVNKLKGVTTKILAIAGAASLAIGLILVCTGVGIPLGIGLILAGAASLGTAVAINWDTITNKVGGALKSVANKFGEFKNWVGEKLEGAKETIQTWAGNCKEFFTKGADGKNALDNIKEAAGEWGNKFKEGLSEKFSNAKSWVSKNITSPLTKAIEKSPVGEMAIELKNTASEWWTKAKNWWEEETKDGITLETGVELAKKGWQTVKGWIGNIPTVSQTVGLLKKGWTSVKEWVGNIPIVQQGVGLLKSGWSTVKDWIGKIPGVSQAVSLAKSGWTTVKDWIGNIPTLPQMISLLKSGWTTVKNWVGNIPIISQGINLIKSGWTTVKNWIGNIPTLSQGIDLIKRGWTTVKNWIGNIPTLSQAIQLIKSGWSTVKGWIGNIPILSQGIKLLKSGWSTVKGWIGYIPVISQGISLIKSGWSSIKNWIGSHVVSVGISLFKSGWSSLSSWIGNKVSVGVSLFKDGWSSIKKFFGLSSGGIVGANGGVKLFSSGGTIDSMGRGWWSSIPKYAKGTPSAGAHGSMFVAGEDGAELVGHVNGTTEVLNRFQLAQVMKHSIVAGMAQFTGYWRNMTGQMSVCANGIIRSILVSTDMINANLATVGGYDPGNNLSHMVYEDSQRGYNNSSDNDWSRTMRDFYHEYVEPTLKEIASDTKRQADKSEQTIVQVGNRTITDTVERQKNANGYSFTG